MELFTITCTTCRARLKVRELAAIGQILACPKCESMVQVVPPPGWQPPTEQPARSAETASASTAQAAGPGSTISLYATPKSDKPRVAKPATAADTGKDRQQAAAAAASIGAALPSGGEAPAADVSAGAVPPASTGALQSIVELSRQHWIVAALAPAACLAIVIGGWMAWRGTTRPLAPDEDLTVAAAPEAPKSSAPAVDAHSAEARPHTYWWWLPSQAVVVIRIPLGELARQPAVEGLLERAISVYDADLYSKVVDPLSTSLKLPKESIRRLTWAAVDTSGEPSSAATRRGVAIVELVQGVAKPQSLTEGCQALELRLGGAICYQPPPGGWPHPFALVDERTIVSGPVDLLRDLAADDGGKPGAADGGPLRLASAALARAIELAGPDAADAGMQAIVAIDLAAARRHQPVPALALLEHWPQGRDDWSVLRELPSALLARLTIRDALAIDLALVCEEPTSAEKVHASLERFSAAAASSIAAEREALSKRLVASSINSATADQLDLLYSVAATALNTRQLQLDEATVWLRTRVVADPPALAAATAAGAPAIESRRLEIVKTLDEQNHTHLLGGLAGFEKAEGTWPSGAGGAALLPPENRLSWLATMLPYYDHIDWHRELNFGRPWNDPANRGVARRPLEVVVNPALSATTSESGFPVTHYVGVSGLGADAGLLDAQDRRAGVFGFQRRVGRSAIGDGAANTIAILGVSGRLGSWAAGGDATVRPLTKAPYVNGPDGFGSGQPDGMLAGMADGSVRFLSKDIDPLVIEQLTTINGGESPTIDTPRPMPPDRVAGKSSAIEAPRPPSSDVAATKSSGNGGGSGGKGSAPGGNASPPKGGAVAPPQAGPKPRQTEAPSEVEKRLGEKLPAIRFAHTTLAELVDTLGQLAGLEITLDPQALTEARIQPDELVSVDLKDTSVRGVLESVLADYGLGYVVDRNQVLVTSTRRQQAVLVKASYEAADLAGAGQEETARLAGMVRRLIEPGSWREAGGQGTCSMIEGRLVVEQNAQVQKQVLALCETLRAARGRAPKSSHDDAQFTIDTRLARAKPRLQALVSVNFGRPTPLKDVLAYLRQATGTQLLVDGPALAALGLSRQSGVTLVADKLPLAEALRRLLEPLKLTVRIIDARTLQITSRNALQDRPELEFHFAADLLDKNQRADALIERVKGQLAAATWTDAGGPGVVEFDAESGCLLVLQSQDVQIRLEDLLETWRKER